MKYDKIEILNYWDNPAVESMYDKHLLKLEINLIKSKLNPGSKILDAGCGECEATKEYSKITGTKIYAVDFSDTRLNKAKKNIKNQSNVILSKLDLTINYNLDTDFDFVISQRFLINLMNWELQKEVIVRLSNNLKSGGKLLLLEGSMDGVDQLNKFREIYGMKSIPVKWHNRFFIDSELELFFINSGLKIIEKSGFGEYFLLTRGIRPYFDQHLDWNTAFNKIATTNEIKTLLNLKEKFSRLVLWVIEK